MYALAFIVLIGIAASLLPFAVLPTPKEPVRAITIKQGPVEDKTQTVKPIYIQIVRILMGVL